MTEPLANIETPIAAGARRPLTNLLVLLQGDFSTLLAFVVVSMTPFVILAIHWSGGAWFPVQDQAVLAMRLDDMFSTDTPLVGAFSRYGWSHPGPLWFWAMAPFRAVFGTDGLVIGSILLVGAILTGTNVLLWRRLGSAICAVSTIATMLVCVGVGAFGVVTPWNPNLAWPLYWMLLAVLALFIVDGKPADLAGGVLLVAMLLQLHVGYALLALGPLAGAVFLRGPSLWSRRRLFLKTLRTGWSAAFLSATVALWAAPVFEQLRHGQDGNLYRIAAWFLSGGSDNAGERVGLWRGLGFLGGGATVPPVGLGYTGESVEPFNGSMIAGHPLRLVPLTALIVMVLVVGIGADDRRQARLGWFLLLTLGTGVVAAAFVVGDLWPYLFLWRFPLTWFSAGASTCLIGLGLWKLTNRSPALGITRRLLLGVAISSAVIVTIVFVRWPPGTVRDIEPEVQALVEDVRAAGTPDPAIIQPFGPILDGVGDALLMDASASGWPLYAPPEMAFKYGDSRTETESKTNTWLVTQGSAATSLAMSVPGSTTVAFESPLTAEEDAELVQAQLTILESLRASERLDLVDSLGSPLVEITLDKLNIRADPEALDKVIRLNRKVESSRQSRLAVIDIGPAAIKNYGEAIAALS